MFVILLLIRHQMNLNSAQTLKRMIDNIKTQFIILQFVSISMDRVSKVYEAFLLQKITALYLGCIQLYSSFDILHLVILTNTVRLTMAILLPLF